MSEPPEDHAAETPMQRALRLKKAAQGARSTPADGRSQRRQSAGMPVGVSKPQQRK